MLVPDEVRKCVVFLCCQTNCGLRLAGTAFFVALPTEGLGGQFIYLITARHVIEGIKRRSTNQKAYVRVSFRDKPAELVATAADRWIFHSKDSSVDVAIFPWAPPADIVDYRTIPSSMVATDEIIAKEGIGPGDEVFLTGLFVSHYGRRRNLPIIRIGNIALMPEEPVCTRDLGYIDAYLIEARSIGGLSGFPVFVHLGGVRQNQLRASVFYWLGLMHGHWDLPVSDADAFIEDASNRQRVNMGIAIVVPSSKVMEVLNRAELVEDRRRQELKLRRQSAATPDEDLLA